MASSVDFTTPTVDLLSAFAADNRAFAQYFDFDLNSRFVDWSDLEEEAFQEWPGLSSALVEEFDQFMAPKNRRFRRWWVVIGVYEIIKAWIAKKMG